MNRRIFFSCALGGAAAASGCRKRNAARPSGLALVANRDGSAVAVVDLRAFAAIRHIHVEGHPSTLAVLPENRIGVLTPENGTLHRIDLDDLAVDIKRQVAGSATTMAMAPNGTGLYVLAERWFIRANPNTLRPEWQLGLPEAGVQLDLATDNERAVITGVAGRVMAIDLRQRRIAWQRQLMQKSGPIRFLGNGKLLVAGDRAQRMLHMLDAAFGTPVVELPLTLEPERFCFKQDGGQLFVTGSGQDAVAVVYPYQTQIAGTILAGRKPGVMAASSSPDMLFIANPESGGVTVMDIRRHRIRAVVPVGQRPCRIVVTPDNNFALALNEQSGDIAVIRVDAMGGRRLKAAPLFTLIPVGSAPVDVIVLEV